jgi:dienelactone hydrolase
MLQRDDTEIVSGNLPLVATLARPSDRKRHPGVVILHSAGMHRRSDYRTFADGLASLGIVVLAYDMRGTGYSNGEQGIRLANSLPKMRLPGKPIRDALLYAWVREA